MACDDDESTPKKVPGFLYSSERDVLYENYGQLTGKCQWVYIIYKIYIYLYITSKT